MGPEPQSDGDGKLSSPERRRAVRQKVHIPAYASFSEGTSALDLNEILDISVSGVAIQTATPLEINRELSLSFDLSETGLPISTPGSVAWTDTSGRAGIQLPELPEPSRSQLEQWMLRNALAGTSESLGADTDPPRLDPPALDQPPEVSPSEASEESSALPDYSSILSALSAVAREAESLGPDLDTALLLISNRALAFTRGTGAAIAFCEGDEMVCLAAAGTNAPPTGARFPIGSGFSGQCVRTGMLLRCDDSETDSRVDREVCRALGIRSMAAVPIRVAGKVIGILEVFSPSPRAFAANEDTILQRLEEITVAAVNRATRAHTGGRHESVAEGLDPSRHGSPAPLAGMVADAESSMPPYQKILLIAVGVTLLLVMIFLLSPWLRSQSTNRVGDRRPPVSTPLLPVKVAVPGPKSVAEAATVEDLRHLAEQGDPYAQFAVGARYATGEDVKQDYAEAVRWFTQAAEQGHVVSQATLGAYYWAGRGIPQDLSKAYFWSILARAGGDEASKYRVAVLTSRMTHTQVVAAQQQADEWLARHQIANKSLPAH